MNTDQPISDERFEELLRERASLLDRELPETPRRTPDCPSLPTLVKSLQGRWDKEVRRHVRLCNICKKTVAVVYQSIHPSFADLLEFVTRPEDSPIADIINDHIEQGNCRVCRSYVRAISAVAALSTAIKEASRVVIVPILLPASEVSFASADTPEHPTIAIVEQEAEGLRLTTCSYEGEYSVQIESKRPLKTVVIAVQSQEKGGPEPEVHVVELEHQKLSGTDYLWYGEHPIGTEQDLKDRFGRCQVVVCRVEE